MSIANLPMAPSDWPRVEAIYPEGIATGQAKFETVVPDWDRWDASHLSACRLIVRKAGDIAVWAALTPVSARKVEEGVAEVSVYVAHCHAERYLARYYFS